MRVRNPHMSMRPLDLPGAAPRRWRCTECGAVGATLDALREAECAHVYPPCPHCGQTPECARDCPGVLAALGQAGVAVVGAPLDLERSLARRGKT